MAIFRSTALLICLLFGLKTYSQVSGTVYDAETKFPLKGVHIVGASEIATSDLDGNFKINPCEWVIVSHVGYTTDTITLDDHTEVQIFLTPTYLTLDQVTVKGNLHEYPLRMIPSSIALIIAQNLEHGNAISYIDRLNQVSGIFVHNGSLNTTRITVRGIGSRTPYGSNRIKAYYNNIPISSGDGSTEIEDIDVSGIDEVAILKGSKSALYGSGLGGVMLLSTTNRFNQGFTGGAHFAAASFGTYTAKANALVSNNKFYLNTGISYASSEGWRQNSTYNRSNIVMNAGYKDEKTALNITALYIDTKAFIPSSINKSMFENAPDSAAPNWLGVKGFEDYSKIILGASWGQEITSKTTNTLTVFTNFNNAYESRPFNILDSDATKWGVRDILKIQFNKILVQTGFEMLFDTYNWNIYETNEGVQGNLLNSFSEMRIPLSVFANVQYELKNKGIIELGASLNTLKYELTDNEKNSADLSGSYAYKPVYSPFLGVNFPITDNINVYSSVSHGFSAPSVEETLMPDGAINTNLKSETGINTEAGLRYTGFNRKLYIDACAYSLWVNNLLATKRESEDVFYGSNAGETWHKGFEFSSVLALNDQSNAINATLNLNYNYIQAKFTSFVDDGQDYSGNVLPGVPEQNFWLSLKLNIIHGFYFMPQYQFAGVQYLNDENSEKYHGYRLVNTTFGYQRKWLKISFGINNLLDKHYASMILVNAPSFGGRLPRYYYPGMPRNYWLRLSTLF